MVENVMGPQNRIIVCLEQSTVEWANTSSRPVVRRFDPHFSRTVLGTVTLLLWASASLVLPAHFISFLPSSR